ncbi:hypothetical protein KP509_19G058800, partial [Ceratopteris richardii]
RALGVFGDALGLYINNAKSKLIASGTHAFHALPWTGNKVYSGSIFKHLVYPLAVNVFSKALIDWVLQKVMLKVQIWRACDWPIHFRVSIMHAILQPYIIFYMLLLNWTQRSLTPFFLVVRAFLCKKRTVRLSLLVPWVPWELSTMPRKCGGLGILD